MSTSVSEIGSELVKMRRRPNLSVCLPPDDGKYIKIDEVIPAEYGQPINNAKLEYHKDADFNKTQEYWRNQVTEWKIQAVGGNPIAAQNCGVALFKGELGVPKDEVEACKYFRIASAAGLSTSMFNLGWAYASGAGVPQSWQKAVKWWKKAAQAGHGSAARNLGLLYSLGIAPSADGPAKVDNNEAVFWYQEAANLNNFKAMTALANCYENGLGVEIDHDKAAYWRNKSAETAAAQGNHPQD